MNHDPRKAIRQAMMIARREVTAPNKASIGGQRHMLAYITPYEAELLMRRGGSGRLTEYGVPAFDDGNGNGPGGGPGNDSNTDTAMSDPNTQTATSGNEGTGAGPTGAGAGGIGETGPDETDANLSGPVAAPVPTAPTATVPFGTPPFGQAPSALGLGLIGGLAGLGFGVPGLGTAAAGIGAAIDANNLNEQLGMMGLEQNIDAQLAAVNAMTMGAFGRGAAEQFGQTLGFDALAEAPMSAFSPPQDLPGPPADTSNPPPYYVDVKAPKQPVMQADEEAQRDLLAARNPMQQPLMYADGGAATGGRMDPRMLPGIHVRVPHDRVGRADGGPVQQPQDEDVRIDDPIIGYHGTPHEFERFDPSKIGTGEGEQMYGHGLYFGEQENTAKYYKDRISTEAGKARLLDARGNEIALSNPANAEFKKFLKTYSGGFRWGDVNHHVEALKRKSATLDDDINSIDEMLRTHNWAGIEDTQKYWQNELEKKIQQKPTILEFTNALEKAQRIEPIGHMYEVAIHARPEEFMDWDKPLSQQNQRVRDFFKQRGFDKDFTTPRGYTQIGGDVYIDAAVRASGSKSGFALPADRKKLSEDMLAAGIPGIKYLDAGSRDAGQGTRNYVVFHPKHLEIKRRYADGGEITPPRDLGADPTVQQALRLSSRVTDKRTPQLQDAADLIAAGQMGPEEYHALVGQYKPVQPYTNVPPMASEADLFRGLSEDKHGKVGAEKNIPEGHPVGLRLDIPAYDRHGVWAPTIHDGHGDKAKAIAHAPFAHVSDPVFSVSENKALNVARGTAKSPFAKINGFWKPTSPEDAQAMAQEYLYHPEWRQVGMDPERHSFFYDRETRQPIVSADEALQVGPLVLAKNPKYGKVTDYKYAIGGGVDDDPTVQQALSYTRKVTPMGFYSHAADVAANLPQQKGTPQQMLSMLTARGVKPDEINNSGAQDTFGNQKTVAKQDLAAHFQQNMPDIQEQKRIPKPSWERLEASNHDPEIYAAAAFPAKFFEWTMAYMEDKNPEDIDYREILLHSQPHWNENAINDWLETQAYNKASDFGAISSTDDWNNLPENEKNKFTKDAEQRLNYLKTTLDFKNRSERSALLDPDKNFFSTHWAVPNVIGHIRMHDRDGEDTLHVEELQSDWGQAKRNGEDVPEHPLINNTNTWTDLLLKRVLREAARRGYKRIAWTPGQEQAERYDLSQQIHQLNYDPEDKVLSYYHKDRGWDDLPYRVNPDEIQKYVGKEIAKNLLSQPPSPLNGSHSLEINTQVGGEGMRAYYDKIVPARMTEITKKLGAPVKVEPYKINTRDGEKTLHSIVVTPELKSAVLKGMPVYKDGGRIGYADGGMPGDDPTVQRALDITRQAQPEQSPIPGAMQVAQTVAAPGRRRFEIAPARVAPMTIDQKDRDLPEEGSVTIKRLTDAFKKAIDNHLSLPPAQQIANARQAENNVAQYVGRGKTGKINSVLTANKKLMKAQTAGEDDTPLMLPDGRTLEMTGLALMPDYREGQFKMCGNSDVCRDSCLGKESGQYRYDPTETQAQMPMTQEELAAAGGKPRMAAFRRTQAMMRDPESFAVYLHELIDGAKIMAEKRGAHLGVRLNVLSDLSPKIMEPIIKAHPEVSFYDYTKMNYDPVAPNHHYTYSSTGLSQPDRGVENPYSNWRKMRDRLDQGHNVAMAFAHGKSDAFPEYLHDEETGKKYRVVSGDEHDFRPLDMVPEGEDGVIIALKNMAASNSEYKYENAARNSHGFFVHHEPDFERTPEGTFSRNENGNRISRNKVYTVRTQPMKRGAVRQQEN
jgi:hypothetical protein